MSSQPQHKDESVADILSAIKDIVEGSPSNNNTVTALDSADDSEPLELTDIVEEINDAPSSKQSFNEYNDKPRDILEQIDSALEVGEDEASQKNVLEQLKNEIIHDHMKPVESDPQADIAQVEAEVLEVAAAPTQPEIKAEQKVAYDDFPANPATTAIPIMEQKAPETIKTNLLSAEKAQKSSLAIKDLLNNIPKPEIISPAMRNGTTIEDVVVESLKPLLKEWLDNNLEIIVRDIVEREIKKLVPKE